MFSLKYFFCFFLSLPESTYMYTLWQYNFNAIYTGLHVLKVITQKKKSLNNFFWNFLWMFPTNHC